MKWIAYMLAGIGTMFATATLAQDKPTTALQRCQDLNNLTIAATDIGLPTKGAVVTQAERAPVAQPRPDPDGEYGLPIPERCVVQGSIAPVDSAAPPIRFNINLPINWNGKALQSGGGGMGGNLVTAPNQKASARFDPIPLDQPYPITLGYVTFGDDDGHQGPDVKFIYTDEGMRNWASDAHKKTRDVALAIIRAAYGNAPNRLYFSGESAGGREAAMMAQRFPNDYDGVIAISPVLSWYAIHLADNNIRDRLIQGWLDAKAISLVAEKSRASCDELDGLKDGVLGRYMECPNDVASLRCPEGKAAEGCLSDSQISAVNAIRDPWSMIVSLAHGVTRYPGFGVTGDEDGERYQYAFYTIGTERPSHPLEAGRGFEPKRGAILNFSNVLVRHTIVQDPAFEPYQFDPRRYAKRIQYLSALFDATNPDLSAFRARGAKLIIVQHSADNAVGTPMVAEYYRAVVARMGEQAASETLRFYVGPGGGHNGTGIGQVDTLALLEDWVEKGQSPPDSIPAYNVDVTTLKRLASMPACRYPAYAKYKGDGDPKHASSFICQTRPDPLGFWP